MPIVPATANADRAEQREETAFVVDVSGSMGGSYDSTMTKLEATIRANINMVLNKASIDPLDEVGLVTFTSRATTQLQLRPLVSHKLDIIQALQALTPTNGTNIDEGLKAARDLFDWGTKRVVRRVVLLTDGHGGDPLATAEDLKGRGVVIDVVGIGPEPSEVNEGLLRSVASIIEGQNRYRFIKDHKTLVAHYTQLANKTAVSA